MSSQIKEIYARCRTLRETEQETLHNPINQVLNTEFTEIENKAHLIFLKTLKVEITNIYTDYFVDTEWSILKTLTRCLYNGDDSQTTHLVSQLPESLRHIFYGNLWKVLGSPPHPYKMGEYAFLNTQNCRASTTEKLDAILCSLPLTSTTKITCCTSLLSAIGDISRLQILLSCDDKVCERSLNQAVCEAAKHGHLSCLQYLISQGRQISEESLGWAIFYAAENDHLSCLQHLLSQEQQISERALGWALQGATVHGHLSCLQYLLSQGRQMSERALEEAVCQAAKHGQFNCLQYLLSQGRQMSERALEQAVCQAAEHGQFNCLQYLLPEGQQISLKSLKLAVKEATKQGHFRCLQYLLPEGRQISQTVLGEAVQEVAKQGHLRILQYLLPKGRQISENHLYLAVLGATKQGHLSCLQHLLPEGQQINAALLHEAVLAAAKHGKGSCLQYLLSEGRQINTDLLHEAVLAAAENGHLNCLQYLLSEGRQIHQWNFNQTVLQASSRGDYDMVHYLVSRGQLLTESTRGSCITNALGPRRNEICDMLRMLVTIPDDTYDWEHPISNAIRMSISLEEVKEHPVSILQRLSVEPLPNSFILQEYPHAIDLGGVSKQVYSTLFMTLQDKHKLSLNPNQIPCTSDESSIEIYETLGKFYSQLINRNLNRTDKFVTGIVFSPHFFAFVKQTLINPDDTTALIQILRKLPSEEAEDYKSPCFDLLQDPENEALKATVSELMFKIGEEGDPIIYAKMAVLDPTLLAAKAFIKGAEESNASDQLLRMLCELTPEEFSTQVQGLPVSNEAVLNSLDILNIHNTPAFLQHVEWLKEKIISADTAWLKKFVFTVTGASTLSSNKRLQIKGTGRDTGFEIEYHTCFNSLDLPREVMEKHAFLKALDESLRDPGYNVA